MVVPWKQVSAALQANLAQEQEAFIQFYEEVQTEQVGTVLALPQVL